MAFAPINGSRILLPVDVAAFLARHPPFDDLDGERPAGVARSVLIEFFPAGTTILEQGGKPADHLSVVCSGAVEILDDGNVVDVAGVGRTFRGRYP